MRRVVQNGVRALCASGYEKEFHHALWNTFISERIPYTVMEFLYDQICGSSGLGHSRRRLAGIPLPVMEFLTADTYMISIESLLDLYWIIIGALLGLYWIYIGPSLDLHWTSIGSLLDLYWIDAYWSSIGLYWISIGSVLDLYLIYDL